MQIIMQINALECKTICQYSTLELKAKEVQHIEANLWRCYKYGHWQLSSRFVLHIEPVRSLKTKNNNKINSKIITQVILAKPQLILVFLF